MATGQADEMLNPIVTLNNILPDNMIWMPDSKTLLFRNAISEQTANDWYTYNVETGLLELSNTRPQPDMMDEIQQLLGTVKLLEGEAITLISQSPDDRYLVYGVLNGEEIVTNYGDFPTVQPGIADLEQKQVFTLPDVQLRGIGNTFWSADGSAFVFVNTISPSIWVDVHYLDNYVPAVSDATLRDLGSVSLDGNDYAVNGAYDLSADGSQLLLRLNTPGNYTYSLAIYDGSLSTQTDLIEGIGATEVIAASFAPDDEHKIWLLNEMGIVQYDLVTGETVVLDDSVNSTNVLGITLHDPAIFSPDGRHLAVLQESGLYVIEVSATP
ncbi:MAG: hypothetical protein K8L97_00750 [Anaerolineae bacterium]|nr:hypothetical protein [Anaerolineae bacterium]